MPTTASFEDDDLDDDDDISNIMALVLKDWQYDDLDEDEDDPL